VEIVVFSNPEEVARAAADQFQLVSSANAVLGFATGNTPLGIYAELNKRSALECKAAFSLDEYVSLGADDNRSFAWYVRKRIEPALGFNPEFIQVPQGDAPDPKSEANRFEALIKSQAIDLQLLGTGRNGHIAFNEPGSAKDSVTRVVTLDSSTRKDNGADFAGYAPEKAITQGVSTILRAKRILLVATGAGKKEALQQLLKGVENPNWPVTYLASHPDLVVLADQAAVD
jgi:glucosamine-6-phosphate deaminase